MQDTVTLSHLISEMGEGILAWLVLGVKVKNWQPNLSWVEICLT
jgi:hypothetical protein